MDQVQVVGSAGEPFQQAPHRGDRDRHGPGRGFGGGFAGRDGLQGQGVLLSGFAAPGAFHCRAGRHQRRQELPKRRRLDLPSFLRHRQRRRLPFPRSQCVSAVPGIGQHHRSVRGAGCPLRPRVRRTALQPLLRWRTGAANVLRRRTDRATACCWALTRPCNGRWASARCKCTPATKCWTS